MTVALGASAYSVAIFHLATHAFFKALLFLAAGSVIIAMHHEQDMRRMGGLRKVMPVTYLTCVIGSLALAGIPPFAGFFSKDAIIEAVHYSATPGAGFAYAAVLIGVVLTAFYSFRLVFMTFHGEGRMDSTTREHLHESPKVVTVPLIALAVPSVLAGLLLVNVTMDGSLFGNSIVPGGTLEELDMTARGMLAHVPFAVPFWLAILGIPLVRGSAICGSLNSPARLCNGGVASIVFLIRSTGSTSFISVCLRMGRVAGRCIVGVGRSTTDRWIVGERHRPGGCACPWVVRHVQSGLVYHYAFVMIIGLVALMSWFLFR